MNDDGPAQTLEFSRTFIALDVTFLGVQLE
jgi:hypothetical protein